MKKKSIPSTTTPPSPAPVAVLKTRSTVKSMNINTCAACHPYFTGQAKFIDTEGRVDRFNKRYARKAAAKK